LASSGPDRRSVGRVVEWGRWRIHHRDYCSPTTPAEPPLKTRPG
jgi:hypothetical protein